MPSKKNLKTKFNIDLFWNLISFGLVAVIGILINVIILKSYDSSALGVFNQIYAIYILLSQLAVGGVHLAVQKFIPQYVSEKQVCDSILSSALVLSFGSSLVVMFFAYLLNELPGKILQSEGVTQGFIYVIGGLIFFSWNKILLAYLNGYRKMKSFAAFQLLRFIFMIFFLMLFIYNEVNPFFVATILAISEFLLFVVLFIYTMHIFSFSLGGDFGKWIRENFNFGNKAFFGNFLLDINTRVDVFVLGIFMSDARVGIYSFVILFAEGFALLPGLLRNNINPIITKCYDTKPLDVLQRFLRLNIRAFYKLQIPLVLIALVGFPIFLWVFGIDESFYEMWLLFAILIIGIGIASGYLPFLMLFNQLGYPSKHTLLIFLIFISNVLFNFLFIPLIGVYGAALGTAFSFVLTVVFQKRILTNLLHIKI